MAIDLSKQFIDALDYLREIFFSLDVFGNPRSSLLKVFDDLLIFLFFLKTLLESKLQIFLLIDLVERFNVDDRLVGKPYLLAPVCKKQSRVSLVHVFSRYFEGADN